jgi:hypothetical protein
LAKKWLGQHFGRFFLALVWSPWLGRNSSARRSSLFANKKQKEIGNFAKFISKGKDNDGGTREGRSDETMEAKIVCNSGKFLSDKNVDKNVEKMSKNIKNIKRNVEQMSKEISKKYRHSMYSSTYTLFKGIQELQGN